MTFRFSVGQSTPVLGVIVRLRADLAVLVEAVRLLRMHYPNPRRSILVGLWGGEEQGLNGSPHCGYNDSNYEEHVFRERLVASFPHANAVAIHAVKLRGSAAAANAAARDQTATPTHCPTAPLA